ncbi:Exodeoxyribonuclease VII small subunit [Pseudobutyrivibrio sp. OR37]|uniref:exodeoxyribonuclease VII small subunit n=1 Tax=Pseudobutyrivibrio sp. OR37 TaxID=1798186 RepID=UPI0008F0535D|nr:exodeoxyribonuclease VII small subunit [Pseudobutyrivibrio sp. OR37]SFH52018.1 Exodeoxyribonuclease VII small subunit [Pseudobutyrivibrio sp. OR37]
MEENNTKTIEESFDALEEIISKLEASDISLDESFELYKNGMEELKLANEKIEQTKKAVMAISKDGSLEVFEGEE